MLEYSRPMSGTFETLPYFFDFLDFAGDFFLLLFLLAESFLPLEDFFIEDLEFLDFLDF